MTFLDWYVRHIEWSKLRFGTGPRTIGITKHMEKELEEVRHNPYDLTEWIDLITLALDGYWRHGGTPDTILAHMVGKQQTNMDRSWPTHLGDDDPIEHDRASLSTQVIEAAKNNSHIAMMVRLVMEMIDDGKLPIGRAVELTGLSHRELMEVNTWRRQQERA